MLNRNFSGKALHELPGVREFSGNSMRDVLADVREVFGREAIILSQENVRGRIHVLACGENDDAVLGSGHYDPAATLMGPVREATDTRAQEIKSKSAERTAGSGSFDALMTARKGKAVIPKTGPAEVNRLKALGFDEKLLALAGRGNQSRALVERVLELVIGDDRAASGAGTDAPEAGAYRFTGPTGHGKSSLIGKLATAFVLEQGNKGVILASTDRHRLGGTLLLERTAELIGVPFLAIDDADIPSLLARRPRLLLVDTDGSTGIGAAGLHDGLVDVLVLAATAQPEILAKAMHTAPRDAELAVTQLDLSPSPGIALSLVWSERPHGRQLDWISYGQTIDASHAPASVEALMSFVVAGA